MYWTDQLSTSPVHYLAAGLEALMKAMQTSRAAAKTAFELLQYLMSSADPYKDNIARTEAVLARVQAVHCCV